MTRSSVVSGSGAFIDGAACAPIWRVLNREILSRRSDGGEVRPEIAEAVETLRLAAAMSAGGPIPRTPTDIPAVSKDELTTDEMAMRLGGITERHARRLARTAGVESISLNRWRASDVALLAAQRSDRNHR